MTKVQNGRTYCNHAIVLVWEEARCVVGVDHGRAAENVLVFVSSGCVCGLESSVLLCSCSVARWQSFGSPKCTGPLRSHDPSAVATVR